MTMTTAAAHRAPRTLARFAQAAILVAAVADVFREVAVRNRHLHPTDASRHDSGFASIVFVYLMTLAVVLFLVWLARSRHNAQALSPGASLPGRVWTIGAWFVPGVHFFVPRGFVLGIGRASSPAWGQRRETALVNLWWGAWVGHAAVLTVGGRVAPGSMTVLVAASGLMCVAAVLLGVVIERVTALQSTALGAAVPVEPLGETV
ncbi:DUF4328 domain-containing protein [Streptomyces sp. NPDC004539]|uniref:DUF4328 domain-containing protein n=1 Tax=Streptomyces sp. NPDC004539 TaxID=3154280 RepID=UPI0033AA9C4B